MISVRWKTKRILKGATEVIGTQAGKPCERRKWYLFGQMVVDIGGDDPPLPRCEPSANRGLGAIRSDIEARKFMYEHDAQGFEVEPIVRRWALEQTRQLEYRAP